MILGYHGNHMVVARAPDVLRRFIVLTFEGLTIAMSF